MDLKTIVLRGFFWTMSAGFLTVAAVMFAGAVSYVREARRSREAYGKASARGMAVVFAFVGLGMTVCAAVIACIPMILPRIF